MEKKKSIKSIHTLTDTGSYTIQFTPKSNSNQSIIRTGKKIQCCNLSEVATGQRTAGRVAGVWIKLATFPASKATSQFQQTCISNTFEMYLTLALTLNIPRFSLYSIMFGCFCLQERAVGRKYYPREIRHPSSNLQH